MKKAPTKKTSQKPARYRVEVRVHLKNRIFVVGVIDTKDETLISLDNARATAVYRRWLATHYAEHPNSIVGVYSFDDENDPVEMLVQVLLS